MFEFETLFSSPDTLRSHREGPLVAERSAYLEGMAFLGMSHLPLEGWARACLGLAAEMALWPPGHLFTPAEATSLAADLDTLHPRSARTGPRVQSVVPEFLEHLGKLQSEAPPKPAGEHADKVDAFVAAQRDRGWHFETTCLVGRARVERLLEHLERRGVALGDVTADHIDCFFAEMAPRWGRPSVAVATWALRRRLDHAGQVGWMRPGLAGCGSGTAPLSRRGAAAVAGLGNGRPHALRHERRHAGRDP